MRTQLVRILAAGLVMGSARAAGPTRSAVGSASGRLATQSPSVDDVPVFSLQFFAN